MTSRSNAWFFIDGTAIENPSAFKISRYRITKSNRIADGSMSMELVANKRKFFFTYDSINEEEMNNILDCIWNTDEVVYELRYWYNNEWNTATVYAGEIPSEMKKAWKNHKIIWKNFNFNLIEK